MSMKCPRSHWRQVEAAIVFRVQLALPSMQLLSSHAASALSSACPRKEVRLSISTLCIYIIHVNHVNHVRCKHLMSTMSTTLGVIPCFILTPKPPWSLLMPRVQREWSSQGKAAFLCSWTVCDDCLRLLCFFLRCLHAFAMPRGTGLPATTEAKHGESRSRTSRTSRNQRRKWEVEIKTVVIESLKVVFESVGRDSGRNYPRIGRS